MITRPSGTGVTRFRDGESNLHYVHVNQEKGRTCRACHEVHASKRPFHVRESVPFGSKGWLLEINFEALPDGGRCAPGCHEAKSYARGEAELSGGGGLP
jgi:predicted CXXCH cytochrome family protein